MKATIGIYESREKANQAIEKLSEFDFPAEKLSIFAKTEGDTVEEASVEPADEKPMKVASTEIGIGAAAGAGIGLLTGAGVLAIPGFGFLFGAGALVGAIAGLDFGIIGGGLASALTVLGMNKDKAQDYARHIEEGKYMLVVSGEQEDILKAKEILLEHGTHIHVEEH